MTSRSEGLDEFRRGWPVVLAALCGVSLGISPLPFHTIGVFAPTLAKVHGWTFAQIMIGPAVMHASMLVTSPAAGMLTDRFGIRTVALISTASFGLSFMAFAIGTDSLLLFYLTWVLVAIAGAGTLPVVWTRAINNWFDVRKGLALGLTLAGTGLVSYLVKPLAAGVIADYGWRAAYVAVGALPLVLALPIAFWGFRDSATASTDRSTHASADVTMAEGVSFRDAIRQWRFWALTMAFILLACAVSGPIPHLENILISKGFQPAEVIALSSSIGLAILFGRIVGGWLIDKLWAPAVAAVLLLGPVLAYWFLAQATVTYGVASLCVIAMGAAAGIEFDLMSFLVVRYFGTRAYGLVYGIIFAIFTIGISLGSVTYGYVYDKSQSYTLCLLASIGLILLGIGLLLSLGRYRRFPPEDAEVFDAQPNAK